MSVTIETTRSPLPENVKEYEGKWIAIRDRSVVAVAETLDELMADERVSETDVVYRVPELGSYFF